MNYAQSIDEAMNLLKGTNPDTMDEEAEDEEIELEKADDIDFIKAEDDEEVAQLIQADDFMLALSKNQDANVAAIVKGLEENRDATLTLLTLVKAQHDEITELKATVERIASAPAPRKAAMSKGEADQLAGSMARSPKDELPAGISLNKSDVVRLLNEAAKEGKASTNDVLKAESGFGGGMSMRAIDFTDVVAQFSPDGQQVIRNFIKSQQTDI